MGARKGSRGAILVAAVILLLSVAAASAHDGFKAKPMSDGYGDFHTLFIRPGSGAADSGLMKSPAYDLRDLEVAPLSYAIPEPRLPYTIAWAAPALEKGSRMVLGQVSSLVVTTPVTGAALLLGSGILCLIGLRRRDRRQA